MMQRRKFITTSLLSVPALGNICIGAGYKTSDIPTEPFLKNSGVGGNNTADMLKRIDNDCLSYFPRLTILMAGTNDMNSMKHIPLVQYEKNMRIIISKILDIKSKIMLMSILPGYEPYLFTRHDRNFYEPKGYKARMKAVNELIERLAGEYNVTFLDMHHIFEKAGNVGEEKSSLIQNEANSSKTDGIHPTPDGYRVMAVAIYECIVCSGLPCNRIVCFGDSITAGGYPGYLRKLLNVQKG